MQLKKFGKGMDVMSEKDRQLVARKCGKLMKLFGYKVRVSNVRTVKRGILASMRSSPQRLMGVF